MKRNRMILPALALLASVAHADAVDDFVKAEMQRLRIPGMVVGIIRDGKPLDARAYGMADLELNVPTTKDNVFEIGSITKQFTAALALMLVEEGKLSLDDPVSKYIPEAPKTWEKITVRHLLFQTSGLQEYVFVEGLGLMEDYDRKTFLTKMTPLPLDYEPGTAWAYSNTNYALLGPVLEKAGGKPYAELLKEKILTPLGMTRSRMVDPDQIVPNRAHGYLSMGPQIQRSPFSALSNLSDGALISTVEDMAKWDAAIRGKKLLKPASFDLMWAGAPLNSGRTHGYGMGWNLTSPWPGAPRYLGHGGNSPGYNAGYSYYPDKGLSVIILGNTYPGGGEGMSRAIAEVVEPSLKLGPPKAAATDPDRKRTERVQAIIEKLAANTTDDVLMEPEIAARLKTNRATRMGPGPFAPLKKINKLTFVGSESRNKATLLTYIAETDARDFAVLIGLSSDGNKLVLASLRPIGPPKPKA